MAGVNGSGQWLAIDSAAPVGYKSARRLFNSHSAGKPMAYYTRILSPDEQVRYIGRLHWAIYVRGWILLFAAAALGIAYAADGAAETGAPSYGYALGGGAALLLIFSLVAFLSAWARRITTEIVVTDRRIIFKEGFIQRRTMEMNMNKVETVDVVQSIWGRIFNFGSVLVRGTGSTYEPLRRIADPVALRSAIIAQ
jgi:hypothetical protein